MKYLAVGAAVLLLAGCSTVRPAADDPEPLPPVVETPSAACLEVSEGALSGIQWGLDDKNGAGVFQVVRGAAIKNPSSDLSWFVAASFNGPGVEGAVGVWTTLTDPTTAPDAAYTSVDAMAAEFSSYYQGDGYSSALPGVREVKDCL